METNLIKAAEAYLDFQSIGNAAKLRVEIQKAKQDPISPEELHQWKKWAESVKFDEKTSHATVNVPFIKRTPPPTEIPEHYPPGC
jgi:hypothetical protein